MWNRPLVQKTVLMLVTAMLFCFAPYPCLAEESSGEVPRWGLAEYSLEYGGRTENPFTEIRALAEFSGPGNAAIQTVEGFYDGGGVWRFRFSPDSHGQWKADLCLLKGNEVVASAEKSFLCKGDRGHGFLRRSTVNPYRLEYGDGTPFYPVGIQPCGQSQAGLDGPPAEGGKWHSVPMDEFLSAFQGAANLFRIQLGSGTRAGCAREIMTDSLGLYRYDLEACRSLDSTYAMLWKYGFSSILIAFQDMSLWGLDSTSFGTNRDTDGWKNIDNEAAVEPARHFLRYVVARWGAYTDIWELFNEDSYTPEAWLEDIAHYVRRLDPYDRLMTTTYEHPSAEWCDIAAFHMYMDCQANETELLLTKEFARLKGFGKPVMNTEFGNQGHLSNYDPIKWRVAVWTAYMNEGSMLFWSMSGRLLPAAPGGRRGNANAYLGPESRRYFRIFNDFVHDLPVDMRPVLAGFADRDGLDRYALSNGRVTVLYLHHRTGYDSAARGSIFLGTGGGPGRFGVEWIDTATGEVVKTEEVETRGNILFFESPEVKCDLAAKLRRLTGPGKNSGN